MATEGDVSCGEDGGTTADDHISSLSDDLLHSILLRLDSTPEAARTSVLARRWRRVSAALPELSFHYEHASPFSAEPTCRRIDEALAAASALAVDRLEIRLPRTWTHFPKHRAAQWLRFASQRVTGELRLSMPQYYDHYYEDKSASIALLPCARATAIRLDLCGNIMVFGPAAAGAFTALSTLRIENGRVDVRELEDVVSSRCPRLKELVLGDIFLQDPGMCIRCGSLERLELFGGDWIFSLVDRLEVAAPKLRSFTARCTLPDDTRIVAPMLSEVYWHRYHYRPSCHRLVGVGSHLQCLDIHSSAEALMQLFDTIEDLKLTINIAKGVEQYNWFLKNTNHIPKCGVLLLRFIGEEHAFWPPILHLLKKCTCVRKLEVLLTSRVNPPACPSFCPCCLPESLMTDSVTLHSLEEIEIYFFGGIDELLELIELLFDKALILRKIVISYESSSAPLLSKEVCNKICRMCHTNIKVEFTMLSSCQRRLSLLYSIVSGTWISESVSTKT